MKWGREVIDIDVDPDQTGAVFKAQVWSRTNVPLERQKIIGFKHGILSDTATMSDVGLKEGMRVMLVGTAEGGELQARKEPVLFVEDLTPAQRMLVLEKRKIELPPKGLINCGMTCYFNSVIQFLRPVKEFSELMKTLPGDLSSPDVESCLCAAFRGFYRTKEMADSPDSPILVLQLLRAKFPQFAQKNPNGSGGYMQQDAEECLSLLLDLFNRHSPDKDIDGLFGFDIEKTLTCKETSQDDSASTVIETSRVLSCHLGAQLSAIDHLHQGIERSLNEKMTKFSTELNREAEYQKVSRLATLPRYLIVHFVRFEWKGRHELARTEAGRAKICRKVTYPATLDVYNFATTSLQRKLQVGRRIVGDRLELSAETRNVNKKQKADVELAESSTSVSTKENGDEKDQTDPSHEDIPNIETTRHVAGGEYELVSIITHQGRSADTGHYVAWVKQNDELWWKFDDETVTECNWKNIDLSGGRSDYHIAICLLYKEKLVETTEKEIAAVEEKLSVDIQNLEQASKTNGSVPREATTPKQNSEGLNRTA